MGRRVLIPINKDVFALTQEERMATKLNYYLKKLHKHGITPVFVWPGMSEEEILERYVHVNGALFIGGNDFDPEVFHQKRHPTVTLDLPGRDDLEISLLKKITEEKLPFLGICRGMQALAISQGGSLIQHLPDVVDEDHGNGRTFGADTKHEIWLEKDSRAFSLLHRDKLQTACFHHQAIDTPGEGMRIVGHSPANVPEIMESSDSDWFCFGIQGHPERMQDSPLDLFFERFAEEVKGMATPHDVKTENVSARA